MIKAYIFDLDGTLVDSIPSISYFGNKALTHYGFQEVDTERYKQFVGDGAAKLVHRLLEYQNADTQDNFTKVCALYNETYDKNYLYLCEVYEGIRELISELKNRGDIIAVLSNKPHSTTVKIVEALFGEKTFDRIYGQREGVALKPDPAALYSIFEEIGTEPQECAYIGDTKTDMMTGKSAGAYTVGVLWGFRDREELETYKADKIVEKAEEILKI